MAGTCSYPVVAWDYFLGLRPWLKTLELCPCPPIILRCVMLNWAQGQISLYFTWSRDTDRSQMACLAIAVATCSGWRSSSLMLHCLWKLSAWCRLSGFHTTRGCWGKSNDCSVEAGPGYLGSMSVCGAVQWVKVSETWPKLKYFNFHKCLEIYLMSNGKFSR
jgi:hypothetical protein